MLAAHPRLSAVQLAYFRQVYPHNYRPAQPLHGRKIWWMTKPVTRRLYMTMGPCKGMTPNKLFVIRKMLARVMKAHSLRHTSLHPHTHAPTCTHALSHPCMTACRVKLIRCDSVKSSVVQISINSVLGVKADSLRRLIAHHELIIGTVFAVSDSLPHPPATPSMPPLPPDALGLKWTSVGATRPQHGTELKNNKLKAALQGKLEFTKKEFDRLDVKNLHADSFIKLGVLYFEPVAAAVVNATANGTVGSPTAVDGSGRAVAVLSTASPTGYSRGSCKARCNQQADHHNACYCDRHCHRAGDCCADFSMLCPAPVARTTAPTTRWGLFRPRHALRCFHKYVLVRADGKCRKTKAFARGTLDKVQQIYVALGYRAHALGTRVGTDMHGWG